MTVRLRGAVGASLAADPGLLRLRLALRAVVAVAVIAAVMQLVGPVVGVPTVVASLIGGLVGMQGSFAVSGQAPRGASRTLAAFPLVAGLGALPAASLAGHRTGQLAGFALAAVVAVFVRRWGVRWFLYGMLGWFSYFFTLFVGFTLSTVPGLLAVVTVATAIMVLVSVVLFPDRPSATYRAARRGFDVRVRAVCASAADVLLSHPPRAVGESRLQARCFRILEAALIVESHLALQDQQRAVAERRLLLWTELAAERVAAEVILGDHSGPDQIHCASVLTALATGADDRALLLLAQRGTSNSSPIREAVRELALRVTSLEALDEDLPPSDGFEPAVALVSGNLPNSTPSVLDVLDRAQARLSLNSRLCVQTAVAVPMTLVLGELLSPKRYYWAVLACFLVLTGTFTTAERVLKSADRVVGTVAGLVAATLAVHLTGRSDPAVTGVMLLCVFTGLYLFRVSYAAMTFAVTTLMGELYNVLGVFSGSLLRLRLEETVLGAGVALFVALVVLPIRTGQARAAAQRSFHLSLGELLDSVAQQLGGAGRGNDLLLNVRRLDSQLHQVAIVAHPAGGPTLLGLSRPASWQPIAPYSMVAHRARALAAQTIDTKPGSDQDLARRLQLLREKPHPARRERSVSESELTVAVSDLEDALVQLSQRQLAVRPEW